MTNEEFKKVLFGRVSVIRDAEADSYKSISYFIGDNSFPHPSDALLVKYKELVDTFEHGEKPLEYCLAVDVGRKYAAKMYAYIFGYMDSYVKKVIEAAQSGNNAEYASLVSQKGEIEKKLIEAENEMLAFDFQANIEQMVDSVELPAGLPREVALIICKAEYVAVKPKVDSEAVDKPPSMT